MLAMGAGVTTTLLQFFGKLDPAGSTYALVVVGTVGAYIAGGTIDNHLTTRKGKDADPVQPSA